MPKYYFTFGANHLNKDLMSLGNCYVEIEAENESAARDQMFAARGCKWAFCYLEEHKQKAIDRFDLTPQTLDQVKIDPEDGEAHPTQSAGEAYFNKE